MNTLLQVCRAAKKGFVWNLTGLRCLGRVEGCLDRHGHWWSLLEVQGGFCVVDCCDSVVGAWPQSGPRTEEEQGLASMFQ